MEINKKIKIAILVALHRNYIPASLLQMVENFMHLQYDQIQGQLTEEEWNNIALPVVNDKNIEK